MTIACGMLTVREDRSQPNGATIQLAVAIIPTRSPTPAPDPVVYLAGGPGSAALSGAPRLARAWAPFLANRDLIVFDQRGTGFSRPALRCPESERSSDAELGRVLSADESVRAEVAALQRCHARLVREGVHLGAYTSAASAHDLEDLRVALGYGRWNLLGISYGTRLALTAMRDTPQSIRSVILDSTYPLQVNLYQHAVQYRSGAQNALRRLRRRRALPQSIPRS
jgi:pimeloyl-ACP methyl ester carboxylesterase